MFILTNSTYVPNFKKCCRSAAEIRGPPRTWDRQKSLALLGLKYTEQCIQFCSGFQLFKIHGQMHISGHLRTRTIPYHIYIFNGPDEWFSGQKLNFYFGGLLFTSHWINLQHWTGFHIAVYGNFQGLFFAFRGRNRPEPPCNFSPGGFTR